MIVFSGSHGNGELQKYTLHWQENKTFHTYQENNFIESYDQ